MTDIRVNILGCPIDNLDMAETIAEVVRMVASKQPHQHVVINADKLLKMRKDPELARIVKKCDLINADGMSVVWASHILGTPLKERVAGIDLFLWLVEIAKKKGWKIFLLGATQEVVIKIIDLFKAKYPSLNIAGYRNGYWDEKEEINVVEDIKRTNADLLFVAMSSPKKEKFLDKYLLQMNIPFSMGVGGAFDVVAGVTKRAPLWMQHAGLEWFYRFLQEPARMWKRYILGNICFILQVFIEFIRIKIKRT